MPFPCFWRRSSSYNVKHDFDFASKPLKSASIIKTSTLINGEEIISRRRTVLISKNSSEDVIPEKSSKDNVAVQENVFDKPKAPISSIQPEGSVVPGKSLEDNDASRKNDFDKPKNNGVSTSSIQTEEIVVSDKSLDDGDASQKNDFEEPKNNGFSTSSIQPEESVVSGKSLRDGDASQKNDFDKPKNNGVSKSSLQLEENVKKSGETSWEFVTEDKFLNNEENNFTEETEHSDIKEEETKINRNHVEESSEKKSSITIIVVPADSEDESKENITIENEKIGDNNVIESKTVLEVSSSISRSSSLENVENEELKTGGLSRYSVESTLSDAIPTDEKGEEIRRRSGVLPTPVRFDEEVVKSLVKYPKSESDEKFIKEAISKNEFLSKVITGRRLQDVVDAMYFKEFKAKEKIIKEGQRGGHMYVAAEGEFEVTKKGKGVVNVMKPGDVFGELAILYNAKRFASVRSITASKVWVIDGTVYQQLAKKSNIEEQEEIVSFLQNLPILKEAGLEVLKKVASLLKPEFFETGTTIVKEGDRGDKFYIITAGSVTVTTESNGFEGQLHRGKCFGEKALLEPITRQATITADDPGTECLTLTQKHFMDNFGKIEDISKITMVSQPQIPIADVKKIVNEYSHLDLSEFKILKTLGVGGFGRVEFIQHKKDPSLTFALKCLKKYEMVQQEQQVHVINEMQIQMTCNSPFIIRLYKTFKDNKYIYFLMEVCLGGDLWSLLQRQPNKNFSEKGARFIAGCVLEALSYLHNEGFVYRDLKPENLLIDNNGYVKMTDFGFAKRVTPGVKSGTFAGTPEYLAPEIILNRGHDKAVDLWAYGIFIYELLNGKTPFRSNDPSYMKTYNNILNGLDIVIFPQHNSSKAKNLITKLLKKAPSERLGIDDIRTHKWFSDFEWEKLRACKITSPFKPKLSSNVDCRYIDHFRRDNDIPPDENSWWDEYF